MVSSIAKAWSRTGDLRNTSQAHTDVAAELSALGGRAVYPVTEGAVAQMREEIAKRTPKPVAPDPAVRAAAAEFHTTARRLQQSCFDLVERQHRLAALKNDPAHRLLGHISAAMLAAPPDPNQVLKELFGTERLHPYPIPGELNTPTFSTASEYGRATLALQARLQALDNVRARISAVLHFENKSGEERCTDLIFAVAAKLDAVQDKIGTLAARVAELEHPAPSRRGGKQKELRK